MKKSTEQLLTTPLKHRLIVSNFNFVNRPFKYKLDFNQASQQPVSPEIERSMTW